MKGILRYWWLILGLAAGLALSAKPWQNFQRHRAEQDRAVADMRDAEAERAEVARQRAASENAAGRERRAREFGYRRPEEVPLEVPPGTVRDQESN